MIIRGLKVNLITDDGNYGFSEIFSRNLTVIRAGNSGGKSTLVASILYVLGMEELLGGKGESVLPYCLSTYFEYEKQKIEVIASEVYMEIENKHGKVKTIRRTIKDNFKSTKLIELYDSKYITHNEKLKDSVPTFIHDSGGAKREEGFHFFLEKFLDLDLPYVGTTSEGLAKLYFQTIFAAHAIEQKRGWTDYLANIPFYGIRDPKTRVVEFILGLDVFEINTLRSQLAIELKSTNEAWYQTIKIYIKERMNWDYQLPGFTNIPLHYLI